MATRTISVTGGNWSATTAWVEGAVPTAADNVVATAVSGALTVTAGSVCRSMILTGYTSTISGSGDLNIGDASGGACTLAGTIAGTWTTAFKATTTNGGVGWSVTSNGKAFPGSVTFNNSGGKWKLADAFSCAAGTLVLTSGELDTNSQNVSCFVFNISGATTRVLTMGSSSIVVGGNNGVAVNFATTTSLTITANTAIMTLTGNAPAPQISYPSTGINFNGMSFVITGSGSPAFTGTGAVTVANFTRVGTATKVDGLTLACSTLTVAGTLTLTSNSVINRMIVSSATRGVTATINAAAVALTNTDFMDIAGAGVAAPFTGTSMGDALGNSGVTFDASTTQTHTASAGGNWSDVTKWTSRVPLPQDDVIVNGNTTGTLTMDMPRLGANLTYTGFVGTLTTTISNQSFGSITLASGMTYSGAQSHTLSGRSSHTITSSGVIFFAGGNLFVSGPGGTYTLQDALTIIPNINIDDGTFVTNNLNVSCQSFISSSGRTRTVTLGTSTVTLSRASTGGLISLVVSNLTFDAATATFVISAASASDRTVTIGGQTIGTVTYTVANSPGNLIVNGGGVTFGTLNVGSGRTLTLPSGSTVTVTTLNVSGAANPGLYLPNAPGHFVSSPDSAPISVTGDIDIQIRVAVDNLIPGSPNFLYGLVTKYQSGTTRAYRVDLGTGGAPKLYVSTDGLNDAAVNPGASATLGSVGIVNGQPVWVRVTRVAATGSINYYYSAQATNDPTLVVWTQLGATVVGTAGNIADTTSQIEIGSVFNGNFGLLGMVYRARVLNGIAGTVVFDADFTAKAFGANSFVESSTNAATVTITGSLAQVGDGRLLLNTTTPGSTATISKASGTVEAPFMFIQDSIAAGGATFYAPSSVNGGNNTGWNFNLAPFTVSDLLGASDSATPVLGLNILPNDLIGALDTATPVETIDLSLSELLGSVDTLTPVLGLNLSIADSLGLIDASSFAFGLAVQIGDSLGLLDARAFTSNLNLTDLLGSTDLASPVKTISIVVTDLLGLFETILVKILHSPTAIGLDIWIEEPISIEITIEEPISIEITIEEGASI